MSLAETTKSIKSVLAGLGPAPEIDEDERVALMSACEQLKDALESPMDTVLRIIFAPYAAITVRIAIDVGLFDAFAAAPNGELATSEIVVKTGVEEALLNRWLPLLVGYRFLEPISHTRFKALPRVALFATGSPLVGSMVHFGLQHETIVKLPSYFEQNGYKNPTDAFDGPFQFAAGVKEHFFTWLENHPREQQAFNLAVSVARSNRGEDWFDFFPLQEKVVGASGLAKEDVLLVDVGGGRGHDLIAFKAKYSDIPGRLILEDLPAVIDDVQEKSEGIEFLKHDFFAPQPIRGAKIYYMRNVLHDWPDKQAKEILERTKEAMSASSLLLINEVMVPDSGMTLLHAQWDITMLSSLSSLERTHQQWTDLLVSSGFKINKIWDSKSNIAGTAALIEAVLA